MAAPAWGSLSGANVLIWIGIALCITQSAILSGLNLAIFSISKLRLEVEVAGGNRDAFVLLDLRKDSNLTLATVLWGNVTINVLLTLLSDSVLAGVGAFVFSTIVITLFGEIIPQAYFSRNAIRMAALGAPTTSTCGDIAACPAPLLENAPLRGFRNDDLLPSTRPRALAQRGLGGG